MKKRALGEIVKGARGIILGIDYNCSFIQAIEIYIPDEKNKIVIKYVETENLAKVFISQHENAAYLKYREVLLMDLEGQSFVGELKLVELEETEKLKEKLLCGIRSKLTEEEIKLIFDNIGQSTE